MEGQTLPDQMLPELKLENLQLLNRVRNLRIAGSVQQDLNFVELRFQMLARAARMKVGLIKPLVPNLGS
jgi:hypothetical protein